MGLPLPPPAAAQRFPHPDQVEVKPFLEFLDPSRVVLPCEPLLVDADRVLMYFLVPRSLLRGDVLKLGERCDVGVKALARAFAVGCACCPIQLLVQPIGILLSELPRLDCCLLHLLERDDGHDALLADAVLLGEVRDSEPFWVLFVGLVYLPFRLVAQQSIDLVVWDCPSCEVALPFFVRSVAVLATSPQKGPGCLTFSTIRIIEDWKFFLLSC
mmetsp:Transcript_290/g.606  ORF Transcript_290/g.606 Transcript_290/m.606 type:complete len:214 (-) Transcript_290:343-984(-)